MKKIISLMAVVTALIMMLSACTPSGMPTSLVGVWKTETEQYVYNNGSYTDETETYESYIEFTDDDYYISANTKERLDEYKNDKKNHCSQIVKATCNELYVKGCSQISDDSLMIIKYELVGDKLTIIENSSYVAIYTKE
ncbi:MAG: hypothetical protein J6Y01_00400 [Spirochaetales bacterium]|nr:hypothetical protein [Spirochaetales bacterium]